ncbi:hypothetical protein HY345_03180 [Candidatus Microgenomates bacterium]|nr:hypothetical protein [Candidatus Microgenomates bacterium]
MKRFIVIMLLALSFILSASTETKAADSIMVNPFKKYQTITGWEAADYIGERGYPPYNNLSKYKNLLLDKVVNEYGLNRVRLEVRPVIENKTDYFQKYIDNPTPNGQWNWVHQNSMKFDNDNDDPNVINPAGFIFTSLDDKIDESVLDLRRLLSAKGEKLIVNLTYVGFGTPGGLFQYDNPDEYAEYMLAIFSHMQKKYGFVPDLIEIELEPDNNSMNYSFSAKEMGEAIVATKNKLSANGFNPKFVVPNTTNLSNALPNFKTILDVLCANLGTDHWPAKCKNNINPASIIAEFGYHRYQPKPNPLDVVKAIGQISSDLGIGSAMLEWWENENNYNTLYSDLTDGMNTAWQQDAILSIYNVSNDGSTVTIADKSKYIRQFTYYIRPGATRIDALATNSSHKPVAFINKDGKYVVVIIMQKQINPTALSVSGLPAGTYGITYTDNNVWNQSLLDKTISAGNSIDVNLNVTGVMTIYQKNKISGTVSPSPTATPTMSFKPGDANGDGKVDGIDYVIWLNHYNQFTNRGRMDGDFNNPPDGKVDGLDYVIWINNID